MKKVLSIGLIFAAGFGIGFYTGSNKSKKSFDEELKKIINDRVKKRKEEKESKVEETEKDISSNTSNKDKKKSGRYPWGSTKTEENKEIEVANKIISDNNYSVKKTETIEAPYIIEDSEYGEFDDYEQISLVYYSDDILAEDPDGSMVEPDDIIGAKTYELIKSMSKNKDYESSVFVRNDRLKCDYEIVLDGSDYNEEMEI